MIEETQQDKEVAGDDDPIVGEDGGKADTTAAWEQDG